METGSHLTQGPPPGVEITSLTDCVGTNSKTDFLSPFTRKGRGPTDVEDRGAEKGCRPTVREGHRERTRYGRSPSPISGVCTDILSVREETRESRKDGFVRVSRSPELVVFGSGDPYRNTGSAFTYSLGSLDSSRLGL